MFDVGFSELVVIGIVALVVIGPERLPKVARTVGHLLGRMQRYVSDVKADINREIQLDELKKLQTDVQDTARNFEMNILGEMQEIEQSVGQHAQSLQVAMTDLAASAESPVQEPAAPEVGQASAVEPVAELPPGETPTTVAKA